MKKRDLLLLDTFLDLKSYLKSYSSIYEKTELNLKKNVVFNTILKQKVKVEKIEDATINEEIYQEVEGCSENNSIQSSIESSNATELLTQVDKNLAVIKSEVDNCQRCALAKSRHHTVFGAGSSSAKVVLVGEAPGEEEDLSGKPFIGPAGDLLTKMLHAIKIERDEVFICNVLKCRPPLNRDPKIEEIKECSEYLDRQLAVIKPKVILALGRIAAQRLLGFEGKMIDFRLKIHNYKGIPVVVTYHPSALLRNVKWKRPAWADLQYLESFLTQ